MIRYLLIILLSMHAAYAGEAKSKLFGTWSSDDKATQEYLSKHALLSEYQKKVLPVMFGKCVIIFRPDDTGVVKCEARRIPKMNGQEIDLPASELSFTFEILGETTNQIVVKTTGKEVLFKEYPFTILKFEDANNYSVMLSDGAIGINGREFFKRIEKPVPEQAAPTKP